MLQMSSRGVLSVVAEKLPTTHVSLPEGSFAVGPSGITQSANGTVYYIVGEARDKGFREVYRLDRQGKAVDYTPLPDSLFRVSRSLTRLKAQ